MRCLVSGTGLPLRLCPTACLSIRKVGEKLADEIVDIYLLVQCFRKAFNIFVNSGLLRVKCKKCACFLFRCSLYTSEVFFIISPVNVVHSTPISYSNCDMHEGLGCFYLPGHTHQCPDTQHSLVLC
jgi:hypothetical protein